LNVHGMTTGGRERRYRKKIAEKPSVRGLTIGRWAGNGGGGKVAARRSAYQKRRIPAVMGRKN